MKIMNIKQSNLIRLWLVLSAGFWCFAASSAHAVPGLSLGFSLNGQPGSSVNVPLSFTNSGSVASLQFDVHYDAAQLSPGTVLSSSSLTATGHGASAAIVSPGILRVVLTPPLNNTAINSGMAAELPFTLSAAITSSQMLNLSNVIMSDDQGKFVLAYQFNSTLIAVSGDINSDSDGDGMADGWEIDHGLDPLNLLDAISDYDADGLSALAEFRMGTDPTLVDTDGDGSADADDASPLDPGSQTAASQYYVLNPLLVTGAINVVSLVNNNTITAGATTLRLNVNELGTIPAASVSQGMAISGTGAFTLGSAVNATDLPVPSEFAGTAFVVPQARNTHYYDLQSLNGDAQVQINAGTGFNGSVTVPQGQVVTVNAGADNTVSAIISSDKPILVTHRSSSSVDTMPIPPASTDVWGIRSTAAYLGALQDGTTVTVYASNGATSSYTLNAGGRLGIGIGSNASQGGGNALHIVADKPIGAAQFADGDGEEATSFWNKRYMARHYGIPVDTQYIAVVCPEMDTSVTLTDGAAAPVTLVCSGDTLMPGKAYFGSTTSGINVSAGAILESSKPVYVIYEAAATNDEHNLLGSNTVPRASQYYVLNPLLAAGAINVVSLVNNNTITAGATTLRLNVNELGTIPAASVSQGMAISGTGAFTIGSAVNATDLPVPSEFAGTAFVVPQLRNTHYYDLRSLNGDAVVRINTGTGFNGSVTVPQGQVVTVNAGADNTVSAIITSDQPILVTHRGSSSVDTMPIPPASTDLWGIRSAFLGALQDGTTVTVYASNGATASYTLNAGARLAIGVGSSLSQGGGSALHIVADKPVGAAQFADGDGEEATSFWSRRYMATHYGIPVDTQYIVVVCPEMNTSVTLTDGMAAPVTLICSGDTLMPGKAYFGSATNGIHVAAGAILESSKPVYVIYEAAGTNDEHNLLGK